jgi:hypothetical protein
VVVDAEGQKKTNKTTLRSEWRGLQKKERDLQKKEKKALTGPTFLEMYGYVVYQAITSE